MGIATQADVENILDSRLGVELSEIEAFCQRWQMKSLALFGSVLRDDFSESSDVDILVTYADGVRFGLHDFLDMKDELATLLGRTPDLLEQDLIKNPFLKAEILSTAQTIYVSE